jgi:hypothetical protein
MNASKENTSARRGFLQDLISAAFALSALPLDSAAISLFKHHSHNEDRSAGHGCVVFGSETVYLSHLPLFKSSSFNTPHDYQVILEATFSKEGEKPQEAYFNDRKKTGTKLYTLSPENFILPHIASSTAEHPQRRSFRGTVFREHFEREGKPILEDVTIEVTKVIHFRKFDASAKKPAHMQYLLFGKGKELFLAHYISAPPDFDQILAVTSEHTFTDEELGKGLLVTLPQRKNAIGGRLKTNQSVVAEVQSLEANRESIKTRFKAGVEFYFEDKELAS